MFVGQAFAAAAALAIRRDRWRDWQWSLLGTAIVALSILPWIGPLRRVAAMDEYWPEPPDAWFLIDYFQAYFGGDPILSIVCGALLAALPFTVLRRPGKDEERGRLTMVMVISVLGASVCVSLALAYARSVLTVPMLIPRFTIVFLPAILILIAIAIVHLRPRALRTLVLAAVAVLAIAGLLRSGYYTEVRKEQWREAADCMLSDSRFSSRSDACLSVAAAGFQYYVDQRLPEFRIGPATAEALRNLVDDDPAPPVLWLLTARDLDPGEEFKRMLNDHYVCTDQVKFLKTSLERWERRCRP
jgi:hypothetical protein